jgi:hypothetical protein
MNPPPLKSQPDSTPSVGIDTSGHGSSSGRRWKLATGTPATDASSIAIDSIPAGLEDQALHRIGEGITGVRPEHGRSSTMIASSSSAS